MMKQVERRYINESYSTEEVFAKSWLTEMAQQYPANSQQLYKELLDKIKDMKQYDSKNVHKLTDNWWMYNGSSILLYWYVDILSQEIVLGSELDISHQTLKVNYIVKNGKFIGKPPYASDLYDMILQQQKSHGKIRIFSDYLLSDEGFAIWKKLFNQGHKISVYDRDNDGELISMENIDELKSYFGKDEKFRRYQFVLTENTGAWVELRAHFSLRKLRRLAGII